MTTDLDIYRSATVLVTRYGDDARSKVASVWFLPSDSIARLAPQHGFERLDQDRRVAVGPTHFGDFFLDVKK